MIKRSKNSHGHNEFKAISILLLLIIILIMIRSYTYLRASSIILSEKVTDVAMENKLNLNNSEPSENNENVVKEKNEKTIDQNFENLTSDTEYIYSKVLDYYYSLEEFNALDIEALKSITGIGDVTANAIVSYRDQFGKFKAFSDLQNIKGIGEKKLEKWIVYKP